MFFREWLPTLKFGKLALPMLKGVSKSPETCFDWVADSRSSVSLYSLLKLSGRLSVHYPAFKLTPNSLYFLCVSTVP